VCTASYRRRSEDVSPREMIGHVKRLLAHHVSAATAAGAISEPIHAYLRAPLLAAACFRTHTPGLLRVTRPRRAYDHHRRNGQPRVRGAEQRRHTVSRWRHRFGPVATIPSVPVVGFGAGEFTIRLSQRTEGRSPSRSP
jgi:hypothetical protein